MKIRRLSLLAALLVLLMSCYVPKNPATNTINLALLSLPQENTYNNTNCSIKLSVKDDRAANRINILYKHDNYLTSKPVVNTNQEIMPFVLQSFISYMQGLGFNVSDNSLADYTMTIYLNEFNVSYMTGIGWSGVANMNISVSDRNSEVVYPNAEIGGRITKNGSGEDYKTASDAINNAYAKALKSIDWDRIASSLIQRNNMQHENSNQVNVQNNNQQIIQYVQTVQQPATVQPVVTTTAPVKPQIVSDVDKNIPQSNKTTDNTYVLIIANEEYEQVDNVNFAMHDGEIFKEYCVKTLGVPEEQIRFYPNATFGKIVGGVDWLKYALDNFEGSKGIVFYCGHGIPDEKSGEAFIIPVDGKGTNTTTCYSLNTLYKTLAETKASNITYFMDACFTGANKEGSMLVAARGVAREPAKATVGGNTVVFSASSGDETAMTYPEKGHGLFTYFLLKKLQETGGDVNYSELSEYINNNVKKKAFLINEKPQTPVTATSPAAQNSWRDMKLK